MKYVASIPLLLSFRFFLVHKLLLSDLLHEYAVLEKKNHWVIAFYNCSVISTALISEELGALTHGSSSNLVS